MKALVVILIALIVGGAGFVGGTYYGEKVQKDKTGIKSAVTAQASPTGTIGTRSAVATATQTATAQGIKITSPVQDATVSSPLTIIGEAIGSWYFEGEFTVSMVDANGAEVALTIAKAQGDWMTESYAPFTATMDFKKQLTPFGYLVFKKNNPSGQPSGDQEFKLKVNFIN